jgi:hypothetical protein
MDRLFTAKLLLALVLALANTLPAQQPAPLTWELGHANATVLLGADIRSFRASQVGQSFNSQMQQVQQAGPMMFPFTGFQVLSDIDKVFLSSPGNKTAGSKENPPFLLVLEGTFPEDHLRLFRSGAVHLYRTIKIYGPSKVTNPSLAIPDAHTILVGDEKSIRDAIDRHGRKTEAPSLLLERAAALASKNDIWLIARDSISNLQPAGVPVSPMAAEVEGVEAGVSARDGFVLELSIDTKTEAAARQLAQLLTTQMETALATKLDREQSAILMRSLRINSEGNRMALNFSLSKEELEQRMREMQTAPRAFTSPGPGPAPAPAPKSSTPRSVKIYGLDEGVREIPLKP